MSKSALPLPTGTGGGKKLFALVVVLMLLVLVVKYPTDAASWAKSVVGVVGDVVNGLVTFVRTLSK
jgi:hypothetical protein